MSSPTRVVVVAALALPAALALSGCPDLGDAPFFCNNGDPTCPEGYFCQLPQKVCVRQGGTWRPPAEDMTITEAPLPDADSGSGDQTVDTPQPDLPPQPSQTIVITEFMADPNAVLDSAGEYLELFNVTKSPIDINGWTIKDDGSDSHTINAGGPLMVPAEGYIVLGINKTAGQNGGVGVAYQYTNFFLSNKADEVLIIDTGGKIVDKFAYDDTKGWSIPSGAALSLRNPFLDKDNAANWCAENSAWSSPAGDKGSPGADPGCL